MRTRLALIVGSLALVSGCGGGGLTDAERDSRSDAHELAAAISRGGHLVELGRRSPQLDYCYGVADRSHPIGVTATYVYTLEGASRSERAGAITAVRRAWQHDGWQTGAISAGTAEATNGERSILVHARSVSVSITAMTPCVRSDHPEQMVTH